MTAPASIFAALSAAKNAVGAVAKKERNTQQGFNFRGIDAVVNAVAPALNEFGVITVPKLESYTTETVEVGQKRTQMAHVTGVVKYSFYGPDGSSVDAIVLSESMDSGDKAVAKMMSVAYRIALLQVLNLPTDEPDPDSVSFERAPKPDIQELVASVTAAANVDELRSLWEKVGAAGFLTKDIVLPTGEKVKFQDYLKARGEELATKSSPSPAGEVPGSGRRPRNESK